MTASTNKTAVNKADLATRPRPVHLDLTTFKFPITSITSILHRISGLILFLIIPGLLWMFDASMSSEVSFNDLKAGFDSFIPKFVLWASLSALAYHLVAGIKHLIMDWGVGETLEGGRWSSIATLVISAGLLVLLGLWIW